MTVGVIITYKHPLIVSNGSTRKEIWFIHSSHPLTFRQGRDATYGPCSPRIFISNDPRAFQAPLGCHSLRLRISAENTPGLYWKCLLIASASWTDLIQGLAHPIGLSVM
jgi:hypothetical protein